MKALERRQVLIELLCERRHDKIENLAFELNVNERTISGLMAGDFEWLLLFRKRIKLLWIRFDRRHGWLECCFLAFIQPLCNRGMYQCLLCCNKHC